MSTAAYADAVVAALAGDFPDLADPVVADLLRRRINERQATDTDVMEFILDDPIVARWRIVSTRVNPRRVRLRYCRPLLSEADEERLERLNGILAGLDTGGQR